MRPPASSDRLAAVASKAVVGLLPKSAQHTGIRQNACKRIRRDNCVTASAQKEAPDWDAERLVLRKRTLKPNQLETLRKFEEEVAIGTVLHSEDGVALVEGLNQDAPLGTVVSFVNHAQGILLWRRGDGICLVLLTGGLPVKAGESAIPQVKAILQVADADEGPKTKRSYNVARVPDGNALAGAVVDWQGRAMGTDSTPPQTSDWPLISPQMDIAQQEDVHEALYTGVKAVDVLTPLGRGQSLLVAGPKGAGKSSLVLDAILGQRDTGVRCIYAATKHTAEQVSELSDTLQRKGAMAHTTVIFAPPSSPPAQRFVVMCTAVALAERARSKGDHALVVLDDLTGMVDLWDSTSSWIGAARSGTAVVADGDKVQYEGMLISAAAAEGRRFFSSILQRSGKSHRKLGGGSLTLLGVVPGMPAAGQPKPRAAAIAQYTTLSDAQKAKLLAALERQVAAATPAAAPAHVPGMMPTEVVEELMSIADGQVVLHKDADATVGVDARLSISRIGSRAYPPALAALAPSIRLQLAQAVDAARFGSESQVLQEQQGVLTRFKAALTQLAGHPVPLEELVALLVALQRGAFQDVATEVLQMRLRIYVHFLRRTRAQELRSIAATQTLTDSEAAALSDAYQAVCQQFEWN
ncbi:hypothetical protein WJX73_003401 [Symbiochloris irregularis]|uniref:AAA+ ATPase domain-containing protein n=1 Tax=Symbiochloris irregularis TaxID=706552 RepID=A0AAW1NTN7_9CHLO